MPLAFPVPDNAWQAMATNAEYVWDNYLPKGGSH